MKVQIKFLLFALIAMILSVGTAFSSPIEITGLDVEKVNGEYLVLVSLENLNPATGDNSRITFTIEELGTTKDLGFVVIDNNDTVVVQYALNEITDSYSLLRSGSTYIVKATTDGSTMTKSFLFGSQKSTDGLDLVLDSVRVDGVSLTSVSDLQVMNGDSLSIDMLFTSLANFDNARIMVTLEGYEHSPLVGSTEVFSVVEGKQYRKTLNVRLPSDMVSMKDYTLRIFGANDLSGLTYKEFTLYIDTERHRIDVLDLVTTPSSGVEPGQNMIANVRMKNRGQKNQDSVKVTIEVDELGISESSYISNLNSNEVATSDDMLIYIPETAQAGTYNIRAVLSYNDGYTETSESFSLNVIAPKTVEEKNLMVSFKNNVELKGGETKTIEFVVANPNSESKPISIGLEDAVWANVEVSPSLAMVKGGESQVFKISVTPKDSVSGERSLNLVVKEGSDIIEEIEVKTYVEEGAQGFNMVNILLGVLLFIAIIILLALVITIARRKGNDREEEYSSNEEYY